MSQLLKTSLCLTILSFCSTLSACGVLWPNQADRPPIVLTKVASVERPVLLDPSCPQPPAPPAKPEGHNTLSADAADYFARLDGWAMACADLNEAIEAILRPSTEAKPDAN